MILEMERKIEKKEVIDANSYYQLISTYGKEEVKNALYNHVILSFDPNKDLYQNQIEIFKKYGYYLATLKENPYQSLYLEKMTSTRKSTNQNILTTKEEIYYGFHLLKRPYIHILKEDNITLDLYKIIHSIKTKEMAEYFLKKFECFYQVCTRTSNFDNELKKVLNLYREKYLQGHIPDVNDFNLTTLDTSNEVLSEEYLKDQLDMYIDYSIAVTNYLLYNRGLIIKFIRQYQNLPDEDILYQEGVFGLMKAIQTFDIRKCCHFSNYGLTAIKFDVLNSIKEDFNLIRVPRRVENNARKIRKAYEEYAKKYGRKISNEQLMKELNLTQSQLRQIHQIYKLTLYESIEDIQEKIDLKEKWDLEERDNFLQEYYPILVENSMEEQINNAYDFQLFLSFFQKILTPLEQDILLKRAGYNQEKPMTQKEVAQDYDVSDTRIYQIEKGAIHKLTRNKIIKSFNPFI